MQGILYASPISTCSRRVMCVLQEVGADWALKPIDLGKGQQKSAEMLAIQPYGKVPAWHGADGFMLFESRAIMQYAAQGSDLVPVSNTERAIMDQWISVEYSYFAPDFLQIYYMKVLKKVSLDEMKIQAHRTALEKTLDLLEGRLTSSGLPYLACAAFTLADLTYMCYFAQFGACELLDTLDDRPALAAWWARCAGRPSWEYIMANRMCEERIAKE